MKRELSAEHKPAPACATCRRSGTRECGRVDCGNRRRVTADADTLAGGYEAAGEGCLRRRPTTRDDA
jgi:hypothetical protein